MLYLKSYFSIVLLLGLTLFTLMPQASAEHIVRVGWYEFSPLSTYDPTAAPDADSSHEDLPGVYGGYNYEYLRMISQINGWKLHFIYGTINQSLARLQAGEVDLVGGVGKIPSREEKFAFPVNSTLRTSIGLIAKAEDTRYAMNDFDSMHDMRVGAVADSNPLFKIQQWSEQRNIPLQFITFDSFEQMYTALDAGEVDAVTDSLITPMPHRKILVSIESQDIYFIGNKDNPRLMQELDDAITQIQYLKPGYQEALSSKYLYTQSYSSFSLNQREKEYLAARIASGEPIRVAFAADLIPIAYMDPDTGEVRGIMADIFTHISELTGLKFEYITSQGQDTPVQIYANMSTDFAWADQHNVYLSQSIFTIPMFLVTQTEQQNFDTVAVLKDSHMEKIIKERLREKEPENHYLACSTITDCMDAVRDGRAGRTYITSYELNYYMNQNKFSKLKIQPVPGFNEDMSIGISKEEDPLLCSIICQALRSIPPAEMNNIILKNTTFKPQHTPTDFIYNYPRASLAAAAILALLIGGTLFFYYSSKKNERLRSQLENILKSQTSLQQENEELNLLSQYDTLTNIPNRRGLNAFLMRFYPESQHFTLAMMDIDEFKKFNDTYGHLAGDEALCTVAKLLKQHAMASGSFTARFGGEEFIWVDMIHEATMVHTILENFRAELFEQNILHEKTPAGRLTISIGYTEKKPGETIHALIRRADDALYRAKKDGRNQIVYAPCK